MLVSRVDGITPEKARDIILFGIKCARDPQGLEVTDYDQLRHHGLNPSQIVEVVSMSALAVYANIIADATGMAADEMFSEF
jgi:alkylhydroperoxidase family enzyme